MTEQKSKAKQKAARVAAKQTLRQKGWSYRNAAPRLGVTYQHLSDVLNGHRESNRLLRAIAELAPAGAAN